MTVTGSLDFLNQYMFRGIRQNSTGIAIWPAVDLGLAAYSGDGGFKSVGINFGTWNSLHTGDTGQDGPSGKLWYESDFYATLGFGFGGGTSFTTTYTAYTSPNNGFTTVKEIMFKLGVDDSASWARAAVKPYIAIAQEFDTDIAHRPGRRRRQRWHVHGDRHRSRLLRRQKAGIAFPIKVGMSLSDYYELAGRGQQVRLLQHRRHRRRSRSVARRNFGVVEHSRRRRIPGAWRPPRSSSTAGEKQPGDRLVRIRVLVLDERAAGGRDAVWESARSATRWWRSCLV